MKIFPAICCMVLLGCGLGNGPGKSAWKYQLTRLKSPGSAILVSTTEHTAGTEATVTLVYDAQNAFGGLMRGTAVIFMHFDNAKGEWIPDLAKDS